MFILFISDLKIKIFQKIHYLVYLNINLLSYFHLLNLLLTIILKLYINQLTILFSLLKNNEDMSTFIKPANLNDILSKIIPHHVNLKNICVSFYISENILSLYKCLIFFKSIKYSTLQLNFDNTIQMRKNTTYL